MKTIAILSNKGGAGKTTLAIHLAVAASQAKKSVAVFDLDPQGSATTWSEARDDDTPAVVPTHARHLTRMLDAAADNGADIAIVDTAPHSEATSLAAARATDLVLVPCRPTLFDLHAISETLDIAMLAKKPAKIILNAVPPRGSFAQQARDAIATYDIESAPYELGHRVAYMHAIVQGITAQEYQPKSKAAGEVENLYQWIMTEVMV